MQPDEERGTSRGGKSAEPSQEEIYNRPWKYIGYKGYSQFIASDNDLLIFRRFKELDTRIALRLQDKVAALEEQLNALDVKYSAKGPDRNDNGSFRKDTEERKALLDEIEIALGRYSTNSLTNQSGMNQLHQAPSRDVKNIKRWHEEYGNSVINRDEFDYLNQEDLICLSRQNKSPLRQLIDSSLRLRTLSIWRDTSRPPTGSAGNVTYFSDRKMNAFVSMVIVFIGTAMLIIPIWILERMDMLESKLMVITVFIFVFLLVLSSIMVTKPFEALGATAAYAAVLMVFIQVGS
ncbi:hypothetical protein GGR52DRAFT_577839 [Hypoxylon sp. FL1284]|nr:hypothetical protein GGR52DRAFT_577839 [Hypoxylon sp. FL1284]